MTSSGHESIGSFPSMHSLAKASPATSLIAETFTTTEQVRDEVLVAEQKENLTAQTSNTLACQLGCSEQATAKSTITVFPHPHEFSSQDIQAGEEQ